MRHVSIIGNGAMGQAFAATLANRAVGPLETTVLIAGDDADAKALLTDVVTAGGFGVVGGRIEASA